MPQITIPLVGSNSQRNSDVAATLQAGKDQRFRGVFFDVVSNPLTQQSSVYAQKRPGFSTENTPAGSDNGIFVFRDENTIVSAFSPNVNLSGGSVYALTTNCGSVETADIIKHITRIDRSGQAYYMIDTDNNGYYLPYNAIAVSTTFTGNRTSGSPVVTSVSSTSGLYIGQLITATGFAVGTRILSIDSATQVTMTNSASSGAATNTSFTRTHLAKIIDADFPAGTSNVFGPFVDMDGYLFILDSNNRVYQSDLNSITSWTAQNYITADDGSGDSVGLARYQNSIMVLKSTSIQFFGNAGNAVGSVLANLKRTINFGCLSERSFCQINNTVYWIGTGLGDVAGVYMLDGFSPVKISSSTIDRAMSNLVPTMDAFYFSGTFIIFLGVSNTISFFYDSINKIWVETGFTENYRIGGWQTGSNAQPRIFAVKPTSGSVYSMATATSPVYQDSGVSYTMTIQTEPKILNSGMGFTVNGVHLLADNQASGTTTLETSGDDYASWVTRGTFDMTQTQKEIRRGGFYKNSCAFRLTHSANTAWRGQAIVVDWEPAVT